MVEALRFWVEKGMIENGPVREISKPKVPGKPIWEEKIFVSISICVFIHILFTDKYTGEKDSSQAGGKAGRSAGRQEEKKSSIWGGRPVGGGGQTPHLQGVRARNRTPQQCARKIPLTSFFAKEILS